MAGTGAISEVARRPVRLGLLLSCGWISGGTDPRNHTLGPVHAHLKEGIMESWVLATLPFVLAILKMTVKNEKTKAKLKAIGWQAYVTLLTIWPEFAQEQPTAAQKKKVLAALPRVQ